MAPLNGASVINNFASQFGQKLFLSETFGVTSSRFANSVTGSWNVTGAAYKMGWSTTSQNGGGMIFRMGLGSSGNTARFHLPILGTFVPSSFANGSVQAKRALNNMGI